MTVNAADLFVINDEKEILDLLCLLSAPAIISLSGNDVVWVANYVLAVNIGVGLNVVAVVLWFIVAVMYVEVLVA
jgi:hypothetical protein